MSQVALHASRFLCLSDMSAHTVLMPTVWAVGLYTQHYHAIAFKLLFLFYNIKETLHDKKENLHDKRKLYMTAQLHTCTIGIRVSGHSIYPYSCYALQYFPIFSLFYSIAVLSDFLWNGILAVIWGESQKNKMILLKKKTCGFWIQKEINICKACNN